MPVFSTSSLSMKCDNETGSVYFGIFRDLLNKNFVPHRCLPLRTPNPIRLRQSCIPAEHTTTCTRQPPVTLLNRSCITEPSRPDHPNRFCWCSNRVNQATTPLISTCTRSTTLRRHTVLCCHRWRSYRQVPPWHLRTHLPICSTHDGYVSNISNSHPFFYSKFNPSPPSLVSKKVLPICLSHSYSILCFFSSVADVSGTAKELKPERKVRYF